MPCHIFPHTLGKVFPSPSLPISPHPFLFQRIPGLRACWNLPCSYCTFTWQCQFSVKRLNVHMHFRTFWCNLLGEGILSSCFECTYWHSMCYLLSIGCNSFSLPIWVYFFYLATLKVENWLSYSYHFSLISL